VRKYSKSSNGKLEWEEAKDIALRIKKISRAVEMEWIDVSRIYCYRSKNSKSRAYARIWGFNRIWQLALKQPPAYIIEVLSEKYDKLSERKKDEILIHELAHIPKNFSGALIPHTRKGKGSFHDKLKKMIYVYYNSRK